MLTHERSVQCGLNRALPKSRVASALEVGLQVAIPRHAFVANEVVDLRALRRALPTINLRVVLVDEVLDAIGELVGREVVDDCVAMGCNA